MQEELSWWAPEFHYHFKSAQWFWASILVAATLVLIALWQRNFLFAVFIVLAEFLVLQYGNREPRLLEFKINHEGIAAGAHKVYSYDALHSFSLGEGHGEFSELVLISKGKFAPIAKISVYTHELPNVRMALEPHLAESVHEESLLDAIENLIGF